MAEASLSPDLSQIGWLDLPVARAGWLPCWTWPLRMAWATASRSLDCLSSAPMLPSFSGKCSFY